ncbi:hypothetical protein NP493_294g01015 [Ridgeia piscesae]|uniref:Uncharacterized protein n=1 Tax=Ridgeia piscesae TaxID=27915 RepID=A0AAD9NWN7_RIDPI|nr:hypothetical protein NP493_294g01015 [Ridgeia piscesae]
MYRAAIVGDISFATAVHRLYKRVPINRTGASTPTPSNASISLLTALSAVIPAGTHLAPMAAPAQLSTRIMSAHAHLVGAAWSANLAPRDVSRIHARMAGNASLMAKSTINSIM